MLLVLLPLLAKTPTTDEKKVHLERRDTGWNDEDLTLVETWCGLLIHVRNDGSLDPPDEDFWNVDNLRSERSCPGCVTAFGQSRSS